MFKFAGSALLLLGCICLSQPARAKTYYPPPESQGDWRSLVPANESPTAEQKDAVLAKTGLDWDKLDHAWDFVQTFGGTNGLLIIRNGWIAAEWDDLNRPIAVHSCTKSLTALAMARLFDLSDAGQVSQKIGPESFAYEYLPASWGDADPRRKLIRIRHLLTMTSGLEPRDGGGTDGLPRWEFVLTRPVEAPPESVWAYSFSADPLSLIIENVSGQTLQAFFNERINAAIGVSPVEWWSPDGHSSGSGGARFTARKLARVGYLALHKGVWSAGSGPQQVVSSERLAMLTQWPSFLAQTRYWGELTPTHIFAGPHESQMLYGHLWWTNRRNLGLGKAVPEDSHFMWGWGGQTCIVVPSANLVVVRLGIGNELAVNAKNRNGEFFHELCGRIIAAASSRGYPSSAPD
jgi:CubicO group peptidase (beta-lactamase class C family)